MEHALRRRTPRRALAGLDRRAPAPGHGRGRRRAGEWMRRASAAERAHGTQGASFSGRKREYWDGFAEISTRCAK